MVKIKKASTPEGRMNQLTSKAFDLAYKQLEKGTIAPSTLNVLLKFGTAQSQLELENKRAQNRLYDSKVKQIDQSVLESGDSKAVIEALSSYRPSIHNVDEDVDYD